jgi:hypothetical protein
MNLKSPESRFSLQLYSCIIIPLLIPLALRGVAYKPIGASALLRRNLFIYGIGGIIAPFLGIKLIDLAIGCSYKTLHYEKESFDLNKTDGGALVLLVVLYPLAISLIGKAAPGSGDGETISVNGKVVGYEKIGQKFTEINTSGVGLQRLIITQPDRPEATKVLPIQTTWLLCKRGLILSLVHNPGIKKEEIPADRSLLREAGSIHTYHRKLLSFRSIVLLR